MLLIWAPYSSLKGLIKIRENKHLFLPFKSYGSSSFGSHQEMYNQSMEDQLQDSLCFYGKQGSKCISLGNIQKELLDCRCKLKGSQETQTQLYLDNLQEANDHASQKKYFMKYALEKAFL